MGVQYGGASVADSFVMSRDVSLCVSLCVSPVSCVCLVVVVVVVVFVTMFARDLFVWMFVC